MYVSTQKLAQIFLYMSTTCCKSFKSFGEVGKNFFYMGHFHPSVRLARYRVSIRITVKQVLIYFFTSYLMSLAFFFSKFFENFIFLFLVLFSWYVLATIGPATCDRLRAILSRKKEEERFLGGMAKMGTLAWQLNVRLNKLAGKNKTPKLFYTPIYK